MRNVKLLAISHPCLEEVNRAVYRQLANHYGVQVHLAIPSFNDVGDGFKACPPVIGEPFAATLLRPLGRHLRLRRLKGLSKLIREFQPTHILVDADPSTLIVNEVLWLTRGTETQVWAMTAENLDRNYLQEALGFLKGGRLRETLSSLLTWGLLRGPVSYLDHLFTISADGTRAMERMGFAGRVTQIPLGFDPALFFPQDRNRVLATRRRLGLRSRTIGYFGRLSPEKGIDVLLEAMARIKDLDWQLLMDHFTHQPTPYIAKLRHMIDESGLADRVVFFESNHAEMPDFMNAADIVVLPSVSTPRWKEQYGRVIPEAMACGKVVVGSRTGAIPELISDAGYLFQERDAVSLSERLRWLIAQPVAAQSELANRAAIRARTTLSLLRQAEIWHQRLVKDWELAPSENDIDKVRVAR